MNYIELKITSNSEITDMLIAEIAEFNFDNFVYTADGFDAYCEEDDYNEEAINEIVAKYKPLGDIFYTKNILEKKNWNEEWEKSFEPVIIENKCIVRASFHAPSNLPYEIIIDPKMSFGTGHHATTTLMLTHQLDIDHNHKSVLDVGCGTAVLAIMAQKLGASHVEGFDIDEWSVENSIENTQNNGCQDIAIRLGSIDKLEFKAPFDIILANINRNILIKEIPSYVKHLKKDGYLLVSGFYDQDIPSIEEISKKAGLTTTSIKTKNDWTSIVFKN